MKKSLLRFVFLIFVFGAFIAVPLSAQKIEQSDVYYFNVPIVKVFVHSKGYYVIYRKPDLKSEEAFIPHKWFSPSDGRAMIQTINNRVNPYLSVYLKGGKFNFAKLALPENVKHPIWGMLKSPKEYDDKFNNESIELKF